MSPSPTIEGSRIRLRPPGPSDLLTLFDWYADPEKVAPFDRYVPSSFEEFEQEVATAPDDPKSLAPRFVIEPRASGPLLGCAGYYAAHPVLELTDVWYLLADPQQRGKGYGSESVELLVSHLFSSKPLSRVGATCDVANIPSERLLEKIGLKREGTLRSALYHHNQWHDVLVFGTTREEWLARAHPA